MKTKTPQQKRQELLEEYAIMLDVSVDILKRDLYMQNREFDIISCRTINDLRKLKCSFKPSILDIYAKELNVKSTDLFKDLLEVNGIERFSKCKTIMDLKMLRCSYKKASPTNDFFESLGGFLL